MTLSATSDDRLDALCTQGVAGRFAVVSEICETDTRVALRPAAITKNTWGVSDCRWDLPVIAGTRQRGVDDERASVLVRDKSVVRAKFPAAHTARVSGIAVGCDMYSLGRLDGVVFPH